VGSFSFGTNPRIRPWWTTAAQLKTWPPTATARPRTNTVGRSAVSAAKCSRAALTVQEGAPLDQVLGRVAADHLFGEGRQRDAFGGHDPGQLDEPLSVGGHGAHGGADARDRELG
jgi:hypothetical protein